jgi:sterol desaturase/sphingolipid hydroxylase (fatty acid hydroxylase superfamily)
VSDARFVSNRDESVPLFKSPWMERLSHVHPAVPVLLYSPVIAYFAWRAGSAWGLWRTLGLVAAGILVWTLVEYVLHRWVFHYEPRSAWGKRIHFLAHGVHHDYPRDSTRLVMPPAVSMPLAVVFWATFTLLAGAFADGLFAGFTLGYVAYDTIHFATHHWSMRGRIGGALKRYHSLHHYDDDDRGFGVSSPLWDVVFGTLPRRRDARQAKRSS